MSVKSIKDIIGMYDDTLKNLDDVARKQAERSYGGYIRAKKGDLHERITEDLIKLAWHEIGGAEEDLEINKKKIQIPIQEDYIENLTDNDIKNYIKENRDSHTYGLSVDKQIYVRGEFVIGIECKTYTENAMLKRIIVDFHLLKKIYPKLLCFLVQLESQLGGDYSNLNAVAYGSKATHAILSYFPLDLQIITLLEGERKVDKPIHKFFKPLKEKNVQRALEILQGSLQAFV